jgi:hypothetical protein
VDAVSLATDLRDTGLTVRAATGWGTRTAGGDRTETVGIVNHWDAILNRSPSVDYYISGNRFGNLIYHIVIRRDGLVDLLGQRVAWHAGQGSPLVLDDLRARRVPRSPGPDGISGNSYTFGVCINYHPDEGPVPQAQYEALVKVNAVLVDHFGLSVNQVIDHRAWTTRKIDINTVDMTTLRVHVALILTPKPEEPVSVPLQTWARPSYQWAIDNRIYTQALDLDVIRETIEAQRQMVFLHRYHGRLGGAGSSVTLADVRAIINDSQIVAP